MNNAYQTEPISLTNVKQAIVAAQAGNRPLARLNLENSVNSEQHNPDYWLWLAWTTDSPAGAVSALEHALRLSPDHHLAQQGLAWALSMQGYDADDYIQRSPAVSCEADQLENEFSDQPCDVDAIAPGDREDEPAVDEDQAAILEHVAELELARDDFLAADASVKSTPEDFTESTSDQLEPAPSDDDPDQHADVDALTVGEADDQELVLDEDQETSLKDAFELALSWDNDVPVADTSLESTLADNTESTSDELENAASDDLGQQIDFEPLTSGEADDQEFVLDKDQETGLEDASELALSWDNEVPESTPADNTETTSDQLENAASDDLGQPIDFEPLTSGEANDQEFVLDKDQETGLEDGSELKLSWDNEVPVADTRHESTPADNGESTSDGFETSSPDDDTPQPCDMEYSAPSEVRDQETADEIAEQDDSTHAPDVVAPVSQPPNRSQVDEGRTILVVDDSPTIRKIVSMSLEGAGYAVVTASDGMEAIKQITDCNPSLVLTDISMPAIDGYQLCKLIKSHEKTRSIPVIMLSGKDGMFDKMKGKFVGCDDYITKPFQSGELLEKVTSRLPLPVSDSHS